MHLQLIEVMCPKIGDLVVQEVLYFRAHLHACDKNKMPMSATKQQDDKCSIACPGCSGKLTVYFPGPTVNSLFSMCASIQGLRAI